MILPLRSSAHWSKWSELRPSQECPLGTLSPQLTDADCSLRLLPPPDDNMVTVVCSLNPTLFKDSIPKDLGKRPAWTSGQRSKASGCDAVGSIDELSAWVCYL